MARARKHKSKHKDVRHVFYSGHEARRYGLPVVPDIAAPVGEAGMYLKNIAFTMTTGGRAERRAKARLGMGDK